MCVLANSACGDIDVDGGQLAEGVGVDTIIRFQFEYVLVRFKQWRSCQGQELKVKGRLLYKIVAQIQ
jgi:hypothetical protein